MEGLNYGVTATDFVERRRYKREPCNMPLEFSLSVLDVYEVKKVVAKGVAIDISEGGVGLITEFPLEPGHVLRFAQAEDPRIHPAGIVKWTASQGQNTSTKAGVQFLKCYSPAG